MKQLFVERAAADGFEIAGPMTVTEGLPEETSTDPLVPVRVTGLVRPSDRKRGAH
jgi:hypothetical protein